MNFDLFAITGIVLLGAVTSISFNLGFVPSTFLVYVCPAVFLSWRKPKIIAKSTIFSSIAVLPFAVIVDYLAHRDLAWYVPGSWWRILGGQPIENIIWGWLWVYVVVAFWESFADRDVRKNVLSWNIKYLIGLMLGLSVIFWGLYFFAREVLYIPYFYLVWGVAFCLIPTVAILAFNRRLVPKVLSVGAFFLVYSWVVEFTALTLGHWYFSGSNYLAVFNFFEHRLPFEEVFFWIIMGAPGVIAWYELFADDRK